MKKIVAIGNSVAVVKALEIIRGVDAQSDLAIFTQDGAYPCRRDFFADFALKKIKEDRIFYKTKDFYESQRINVIVNHPISRINLKRKRITTEDKDQVDFDVLLIADTPQIKFPDIKGTGKTGVFALRRFVDFKKMISALPMVETVVIEGNSLEALRVANAFKQKGKEVVLIIPAQEGISQWLYEPSAFAIARAIEGSGIRLITNNSLAEILGDADVKAIRLKSGKVLAGEMVIFTDVLPDLRVFCDSELKTDQQILTDPNFKTNVEGVFALNGPGRWIEPPNPFYFFTSCPQFDWTGAVLAAAILGQVPPDISVQPVEIAIGRELFSLTPKNSAESNNFAIDENLVAPQIHS